MAPMPTAARYAPTPATYKAPREWYWYPQYPAVPKTYAAVLGMVAHASSLEGLGLDGIGRREEPQRGGYEGSPS
jgi:hypothetical protein